MSDQPTPPASHYLHGTSPTEQQRLSLLNDFLNQASLRELGLRGGEKVLDVGSGLGQFTRAMARAVGPTGRVIGIEPDPRQLAEARRQARDAGEEGLVDFRPGDALAMPLAQAEWGTFDVAHVRFVLEHVRDPGRIVRAMVRAVRPGGRIILEDDDHELLRLWPEPPGFGPLWQAYMRTFDRLGNDPYIGRRLVALLHEAGAAPQRNTLIFFGSCSGQVNFDFLVNNLAEILVGARDVMLRERLLDPNGLEQALAALRTWGHRADAAIWYAMSWAEGARKA
jgi:SAM-dependent methyltransferase